ncbi:hypothetical protein [Sediminicola luteus]|nr:hypothetical protein [Sediminicola luteus]
MFGILALQNHAKAQITQLEFASGMAKTDFTYFAAQPMNEKETWSLATLAFFQKYHEHENFIFDELGVQTTAFWQLSNSISIGPSLYYNSVSGFSERISLLFGFRTKHLSLKIIPSIAHMELTHFINGEIFLQLTFTQPLKKEWQFMCHATILTHWDKFEVHSRSFQQLRAGISYKNNQFGLAVDLDRYGNQPIQRTSMGLYLRKTFISTKK